MTTLNNNTNVTNVQDLTYSQLPENLQAAFNRAINLIRCIRGEDGIGASEGEWVYLSEDCEWVAYTVAEILEELSCVEEDIALLSGK